MFYWVPCHRKAIERPHSMAEFPFSRSPGAARWLIPVIDINGCRPNKTVNKSLELPIIISIILGFLFFNSADLLKTHGVLITPFK